MSVTISWPAPPPDWADRLNRGHGCPTEVHVWAASLDISEQILTVLRRSLTAEELARAERFRFEQHRRHFIAGRGLLRTVLAGYLAADPAVLEFVYGASGKPALVARAVQFNLSHSASLALLAITRQQPLGVDIEALRPLTDAAELVNRFLCRREDSVFHRLDENEQSVAFYNLWTRKEALLKATGQGIGRLLNRVEVSFLPGEPAEFRSLPAGLGSPSSWRLYTLSPAPGYTGALALDAPTARVECWRWDWSERLTGCHDGV